MENFFEQNLLENWCNDESFIAWAKKTDKTAIEKWEAYFAQFPEHQKLAETAKMMVVGIPFNTKIEYSEKRAKALTKFKARIEESIENLPQNQTKTVALRRWWAVAASVAIIVAALGWLAYQQSIPNEIVVATAFGETKEITLPDQTSVILNANSTLRYHNDNPRQVWLNGEAYFKVTKKPETGEKFEVITNDLTINVLGTVFNVNNRNEHTKVFLEEGKVKLKLDGIATNNEVEMRPNDVVAYSKTQRKILLRQSIPSAQSITSWKDGALIFKNATLKEILDHMKTIYGVSFEVRDSTLCNRHLTIGVPVEDKEIAIKALENTLSTQIEQEGTKYIIK